MPLPNCSTERAGLNRVQLDRTAGVVSGLSRQIPGFAFEVRQHPLLVVAVTEAAPDQAVQGQQPQPCLVPERRRRRAMLIRRPVEAVQEQARHARFTLTCWRLRWLTWRVEWALRHLRAERNRLQVFVSRQHD